MTAAAKELLSNELKRLQGIEKAAKAFIKSLKTDDLDELRDALAVTKKVKGTCRI